MVRNGQSANGVSCSRSHGAPEKQGMVTIVGLVLLEPAVRVKAVMAVSLLGVYAAARWRLVKPGWLARAVHAVTLVLGRVTFVHRRLLPCCTRVGRYACGCRRGTVGAAASRGPDPAVGRTDGRAGRCRWHPLPARGGRRAPPGRGGIDPGLDGFGGGSAGHLSLIH